jgi:hypothetical protein
MAKQLAPHEERAESVLWDLSIESEMTAGLAACIWGEPDNRQGLPELRVKA